MSTPINQRLMEGKILEQKVGNLTTSSVEISFTNEMAALYIFNPSAENNLLYSIDGGTIFMTILPLGEVDRPYIAKTLHVKSDSGTHGYEIEIARNR